MKGLNTAGGLGEVFAEGAMAANAMLQRHADFGAFLGDVLEGLRNIGSAAAVIAEIYGDTDFHSSADLDKVAFAFGDYGAPKPAGFSDRETWWQFEQRMREASGGYAMALTGTGTAQVVRPAAGLAYHYYPDGSYREVLTRSYGDRTVVTETIYSPTREVLQQSTVETRTEANGIVVRTTTVDTGDSENGRSTKTSQTTEPDGTVTVTTSSTVVVDGESHESEPTTVIVETGQRPGSDDRGPIEEAQDELDSRGSASQTKVSGFGP